MPSTHRAAWRPGWRTVAAQLLIGTLTCHVSLLDAIVQSPVAHAADTSVVLNEINPGSDGFTELYNTGDTPVELSGWTIVSARHGQVGTAAGSLPAHGRASVATRGIDRSADTVWLKSASGASVDSIAFGDVTTAWVPAPSQGRSIARLPDGSGLVASNVDPSEGFSNSGTAPARPTGISVPATSEQPANTINRATKHAVLVRASVPDHAASLRIVLTDSHGKQADERVTVNGTVVDATVNASSLADGPISVHAAVTLDTHTVSAWATGAYLTKATERPQAPTVTSPADDIVTDASTVTVTGQAPAGTTVQVLRDGTVIASGQSTGTFAVAAPLSHGRNKLRVQTVDSAWNTSDDVRVPTIETSATGTTPTPPTQPVAVPAPSRLHALGVADSRVRLTWSMASEDLARVDHFAVFSDDRTGTVDYANPVGVTAGNATTFTTSPLPQGTYMFVVRAVLGDGSMSANTDGDRVSVRGQELDQPLHGGSETLNFGPSQPIVVTTAAGTSRHGKLTLESFGRQNPGQPLAGLSEVGNFYSLTTSNQSVFPLELKIYYTAADLATAHIASERQLKGLYFENTSSHAWQPFDHTDVNTTDVVVNGVAYAGYVSTTTTHLTNVVIAADTVAPNRPSNLTAQAGDMRAKLSWNSVGDAAGYWVRYRKATNVDTVPYATVFVSGQSQTSHTVTGLANGTLYEFGVAAEDAAGNPSAYSVVEQTPTAAGPSTDFITPATARLTAPSSGSASAPSTTTGQTAPQSTPTNEPTSQPDSDSGTVKGGTDQKDQTQSARSLVTLLIVLIAAAAGFGGYYGYQWWTARPEEFDEPFDEPEPAAPKKAEKDKPEKTDRTGGRW